MSDTADSQEVPESTEAVPNGDGEAPMNLPDDHPLVKTLAAQKEQIRALKERTQRLDQIEESQKTEAEKAAERLSEAERRASEAEARALRREVALDHKLTADDAALLDTITDEDAMRALASRLATASDGPSNYVPREGNNPRPEPDGRRAFADFLTGNA